ncbi:lysylphosphatidylglycerol synthase transmembrane domain-containing protein [Amycolatopsis alkalitolerans]|uniref:Flippase-like domain-containing protein n=1 Tax=Amycolatopsis alkalitolerans TaxID=2547244 RepID=A0A5C4LYJ6_9PSEU|nr:lysylphosphatidylglycerol synthase transmembrane domain-containing protein [Amycolatopsis alkalitolerans]TNC24183.1 flippase-like domain-containing protein [Amycolatopsis alkalitolerans]
MISPRHESISRVALREVMRAGRRPTWRLVFDWVLAAAGIGVAAWQLAPTLAAVDDLGARLAALHWNWLIAIVALSVGSLFAYGELHRRLLRSGGARMRVRTVQTVNFIADAFAETLPSAGAAAGTAYTVAALRSRGADTALSLWSAVVAALLSAVVLLIPAPLVFSANGLVTWLAALALCCALLVAVAVAWWVVRRPRSVRWVAHKIVATARHLPVVRDERWVREKPNPVDIVTERIAAFRMPARDWTWCVLVALLSWAADYVALASCVAAIGEPVPWSSVALGYLAVQGSIGLQLTPAGAGPAEAGLLASLTAGGMAAASAAVVVVLYRAINWVGLAAIGWVVFGVTARKHTRT